MPALVDLQGREMPPSCFDCMGIPGLDAWLKTPGVRCQRLASVTGVAGKKKTALFGFRRTNGYPRTTCFPRNSFYAQK